MNVSDCYSKGNDFFRAAQYDAAVEHYTAALECCSLDQTELRIRLLLNRGQSFSKLQQPAAAIVDFNQVIEGCCSVDNSRKGFLLKAFMRRSHCYEEIGHYQSALQDVERTLTFPSLSNDIAMLALQRRRRLIEFIELDDAVSKREGTPLKMVTKAQALRLLFTQPPPARIREGVDFIVKLCITNELGLWDRGHMAVETGSAGDCSDIALQCEVKEIGETSTRRLWTAHLHDSHHINDGKSLFVGLHGKVEAKVSLTHSSARLPDEMPDAICGEVLLTFSLNKRLRSGAAVLSIVSLPVQVVDSQLVKASDDGSESVQGVVQHIRTVSNSIHASCIRPVSIDIDVTNRLNNGAAVASQTVFALESPGYLGIGGKIWDSLYVMLNYLQRDGRRYITNKRILELGSGTGVAGIALCALAPQSIVLTDIAEVVPLIDGNIILNSILADDINFSTAVRKNCSAAALSWGEKDSAASAAYDTIIASDVVYYPEGYTPLLQTLQDLLKPFAQRTNNSDDLCDADDAAVGPICILAHRHRHPEDHIFFDQLYKLPNIIVDLIHPPIIKEALDHQRCAHNQSTATLCDVTLFKIYFEESLKGPTA